MLLTRGLCATALMVGFGLLFFAHPAKAITPTSVEISLDQKDSRFGNLYVKSLGSLLFRPKTNIPVPTVIYLHGCSHKFWGSGPEYATIVAEASRFTAEGYAVLVLDTADSRKLGKIPCTSALIADPLIYMRTGDLDAAVAWLIANRIAIPEKIVALGTSHGGFVVVQHAKSIGGGTTSLAGGIGLYPGWNRDPSHEFARYPLLILVGGLDNNTAGQPASKIFGDYAQAANAAKGSAKVTLVVYPDAAHGFDAIGLKPEQADFPTGKKGLAAYNRNAAKDSAQKIDAFLKDVFK